MLWREAVLDPLHRFSTRRGPRLVERQHFIQEELDRLISDRAAASDAVPDIQQSPPRLWSVMKANVRRYNVLDTD